MDLLKKKFHPRLILIDLDGTTLDRDYRTFNKLNGEVLTYLAKLGHKVCIATGRNFWSALPYYEKLGLNTLMASYNGAYINNPSKEKLKKDPEILNFNHISNGVIRSILTKKIIQDSLLNALVDSIDREIICTEKKDVYWHEVWFNQNKFTHGDILENLEKKDALQLVLEFANDDKLNIIIATLRRNYHSSIFFDVVNKLRRDPQNPSSPTLVPDPEKMVIRIRSVMADKGKAAKRIASHYNIPLNDVMAFGDSENDIEMIRDVGWGVAMANGEIYLKTLGRDVTQVKNYEGGVGKYLIDYFQLPSEKFLSE